MMPSRTTAACGGEASTGADEKPHLLDLFRRHADAYRAQNRLTPKQGQLLRDMERCRTAALGGHVYRCNVCNDEVPMYNSCANRGCPNCQALEQARWITARKQRILPVGHHQVVFTLPSELRPLASQHPRELYGLLLHAAGTVLTSLAEEQLGIRLGATLVLHTWTRELLYHPHVHCVVTAGGLTLNGQRWVDRKGFLFAVAQLKARFHAQMLIGLDQLRRDGLPLDEDPEAWTLLFRRLPKANRWVVYIGAPFGRSTHVFDYLGRYTHRVGLSDQRLVSVSETAVTFRTRGTATVTMTPQELMRRYLRHVLPAGLNKIRHVGLYAAVHVRGALKQAKLLLGDGDSDRAAAEPSAAETTPVDSTETWVELLTRLLGGADPLKCAKCGQGRLVLDTIVQRPRSRAPPESS